VYDDAKKPLTEECSRLLETSFDEKLKASDDYAIAKCRLEDTLKASNKKNWTILRPTLVYGPPRLSIVTLVSNTIVYRAINNKKLLLPIGAKDKTNTMVWGGDVARFIQRLMENPECEGEIYTVATAETHTWEEIAGMYKDLIGLEVEWIPNEDYLAVQSGGDKNDIKLWAIWMLDYDRMFNRSVDNSKILKATGLKQSDLMPLYDGLKLVCNEVMKFAKEKYKEDGINILMDKWLENNK
jgi:nucleoside-diphosphate-sugar epimerase